MFKALSVCGLLALSYAMRLDLGDAHLNHNNDQQRVGAGESNAASTPLKLTDAQKKWDDFYRGQIKAIGDSEAKEVSEKDGNTVIKYLDTTPANEPVAWEVTGKK